MIQKNQKSGRSTKESIAYERIVQKVRDLYDYQISKPDAHEAARNLIGFCQLLLEMKAQQLQNQKKGA